MTWSKLEEGYRDAGVVLALGEGVSAGCGIPDREGLIDRLAEGVSNAPPVGPLRELGVGAPALATLLRGDQKPLKFARRVRHALYDGFPFFPSGSSGRQEELIEYVERNNPTLRALGAFCAWPGQAGEDVRPNPLVHAVVTWNLDTILETYLSARYGTRLVRTVERSTSPPEPGTLNLYHVHGSLPFDGRLDDPNTASPETLVLGEEEHFEVFDDPTRIFGYSLLHLLREHHFLFIGLSMQSQRLRRLLHWSRRELEVDYEAEGVKPKPSRLGRHFTVLVRPEDEVADALERSLMGLGVRTCWVEDPGEIPDRLQELYEAGGGIWYDVW